MPIKHVQNKSFSRRCNQTNSMSSIYNSDFQHASATVMFKYNHNLSQLYMICYTNFNIILSISVLEIAQRQCQKLIQRSVILSKNSEHYNYIQPFMTEGEGPSYLCTTIRHRCIYGMPPLFYADNNGLSISNQDTLHVHHNTAICSFKNITTVYLFTAIKLSWWHHPQVCSVVKSN